MARALSGTWGLIVGAALFLATGAANAQESRSPLGDALGLSLAGDAAHTLSVSAGGFDIAQEKPPRGRASTSAVLQFDFRHGRKFYFIGPMAGFLANHDGGVLGYGGLYFEFTTPSFAITPFSTVAGYGRGGGKTLDGVLQFYSGATLSYLLGETARLGLTVAHISNADLHEANPGAETLMATYTWVFPHGAAPPERPDAQRPAASETAG